jgi:hypothetical protein
MVENLESLDDLEQEGGNRNLALVAIAGSALAAGLIAFLVRRARQEQAPEPVPLSAAAWDRARELAFSEERAAATREFLVEKVLPELKPALLGILEEIEDLVDQGFRRAEKAIKSL